MRGLILLGLSLVIVAPLQAQQRTSQAQQRTRSPHGDLKMECMTCHISSGWTPIRVAKTFDHAKVGGFALAGAHGTTTCRACHQSLDFKGVKSDCVSCHVDKHRGELGANCARCHTARSFLDREMMVRAHQLTRFPLQGGHMGVECSSCHTPGPQGSMQFVGTQRDCVSCHRPDFNTAPNHVAGNFPTTCAGCHNQVAWNRVSGLAGGSHPTTPIALAGVHSHSQCADCHLAGQAYSAVQRTCDGCHHSDFAGAKDPDHVAAGFSTNCTTCHALVPAWMGATYAHATSPIDPKQGAHGAVTCTQCHTKAPYSSVATTCDGCHHVEYLATTNPSHTAAGYSTDCASCHQVLAGWAGANINHPTSPIALTGVHANRQCADCHLTGQTYSAVQQTCDGCHHSDFVGAKDPDHVAAGFSTNCTTCHALVAGWAGATYASHPTSPIDPKQGAHGAVTCTQCHTKSPYSSAPTTCDGCHHADYVATTNPNHAGAGFALTCADCHKIVAGWTGATFASHPSAPLAMTGLHAMPPRMCTDCHKSTSYSSVAQTCDGCHHSDYIGVTDPNHTAVGMDAFAAANCSNCHSPTKTSWTGPTWTHKTIVNPRSLSLPHKGASCADCHQTVTNYTLWSCAKSGCHSRVTGP